jgi:hypothetical protein
MDRICGSLRVHQMVMPTSPMVMVSPGKGVPCHIGGQLLCPTGVPILSHTVRLPPCRAMCAPCALPYEETNPRAGTWMQSCDHSHLMNAPSSRPPLRVPFCEASENKQTLTNPPYRDMNFFLMRKSRSLVADGIGLCTKASIAWTEVLLTKALVVIKR